MTIRRATGLEEVVDARVLAPFTIEIRFDDGIARRIDLEPILDHGPMFEPLKDPGNFAQMRVDAELGTVVWPNGADLAPEFLYEAGEQIN